MIRSRLQQLLGTGAALLLVAAAAAQDNRTVIGPANVDLQDGANAFLAGDAETGIRLTLRGLEFASNDRERHTGWSNLCAGYAMLEQFEVALDWCDRVLAENDRHWRAYSNRALVNVRLGRFDDAERDLQKGEAIAPGASTLRAVRAMLLDARDPVAPMIVIDDRRQQPAPSTTEDD